MLQSYRVGSTEKNHDSVCSRRRLKNMLTKGPAARAATAVAATPLLSTVSLGPMTDKRVVQSSEGRGKRGSVSGTPMT